MNWRTWSGPDRRSLPGHGGHENANYRRNFTCKFSEPVKQAKLALFAVKMPPNFTQRVKGLIEWDQPDFFSALYQIFGQSVQIPFTSLAAFLMRLPREGKRTDWTSISRRC
jgi:hypothetical protein